MRENHTATMHAGCFGTGPAFNHRKDRPISTSCRSNRIPRAEGVGDGSLRPHTGGTHD